MELLDCDVSWADGNKMYAKQGSWSVMAFFGGILVSIVRNLLDLMEILVHRIRLSIS